MTEMIYKSTVIVEDFGKFVKKLYRTLVGKDRFRTRGHFIPVRGGI